MCFHVEPVLSRNCADQIVIPFHEVRQYKVRHYACGSRFRDPFTVPQDRDSFITHLADRFRRKAMYLFSAVRCP